MKKPLLKASVFVLSLLVMASSVSAYPQTGEVTASVNDEMQPQVKSETIVSEEIVPATPVVETPTTPAEVKPAPVAPKPKPVAPKPVAKAPASKPAPAPVAKPAPKPVTPVPAANCDGSFHTEFVCLINAYRKSKGLNTLSYEAALNATAQDHSAWMNANNVMSHLGENGNRFFDRCKAHGTTCDGENVAKGYTTAQKLFDAWKASPSHNANMLGVHTRLGLGLSGIYATLVMR